MSSGDAGAVSVPSQVLVFTTGNWSTARSVSVGGVDDDDALDESVGSVTLSASGFGYGGVTAAVSVSVDDDDTAGLVLDPGSLTVDENGSGSFDVALATQPPATVSVTVSSGDTDAVSVPSQTLTFTTGNWSTARSVTVGGVDDDDALDETVAVTLSASGGGYGGVTASVSVSVNDDDTVNLVVDPGSLTVDENGSGSFDVALATRPSASVSVTVSSGDTDAVSVPSQTLVFTTGNWSTARSVSVGGVDDDDALDESVAVTLSASGGGYGGVTAAVSVSVDDDDTAGLVLDPGSLTVDENGSGSFDVALATQPPATVSVTVSSGDTDAVSVPSQTLTFTTGNWSTARSVTVGGVDDDDALDETVAVTLSASGGGYSGVTASVSVSVNDDDTVNLVLDPGSLTVDENGSGSFDVALATQPPATVSVTVSSGDAGAVSVPSQVLVFTTGNWSTARSVTVGGVDDDDALDETVTVTLTASGGGYSGQTAIVTVTVDDDDTAGLVLDPGSLTVDENGSGSFEVALATQPPATVSVTVSSGDTDAVSVPSQTLTFTTGNWSTARSVTVGGVDDDDALDETVTVTLTASGGGYGGVTASVSVSVDDDDTVNLVVDPGSLTVDENGSGSFEVALATRPPARVSVTVSSGDTDAVSVPSQVLVFTTGNWSTARSVSVGGVDDDDALDETVAVTLSASGGGYGGVTAAVSVSVNDDDTVNLVVDPGSLQISENGSGSFDVALATRPSARVSVTVSSGDTDAVSVPSQVLVFTTGNWSTARSVSVGGVDDDDALDESVVVTLSASGGGYGGVTASVSVSVDDDDTVNLVVDPGSLTVDENGSGSFDVRLATQPSASVSVTVSSGDTGAVSVPSTTLTFTTGNWSTARSVTVGGVDDDDALDETVTVTLTASGGGYGGVTASVSVSVDDDDTVNLVVDPGSLTVDENGSGSFDVALATQPPASVSVTVSSGDAGAVSVPSQVLVFTTGNWSTARSVTVGGVDDDDALDESVAVTLTASGGGYSGQTAIVTVTVDDDDIVNLVVDPGSLTVDENGSGSFEVALATRPPASVSVTVSSGDAGAVSVPSQVLVFTTGNWSTARSVTVGGVDDDDALDETVAVTLSASGGGYSGVTAAVVVSVDDDDTVNLVVDPGSLTVDENGSGSFEVALATQPPARVSVTVSSGDAGAVSVPSQVLVFTTGNWSTARSVSVGGVDDDDALDESVAVTLSASGGGYGGVTAAVSVSVDDDDTAGLVLDPGSLTVDENGSGSFEVALATQPPATVSVTVSSGDAGAVSVPSQVLVFTTGNWSTARSVTVGGVDDDDAQDETVAVTLTASGGGYSGQTAIVTVTVDDDDTVNLVVDPGSLTVDENGSGSFEVALATRPPATVSVTVSSGDSGAVSVPSQTLTFTTGNWSTARSVTVGGVDDDDALDESVAVTLSASGGGYSGQTAIVTVTVDDDDIVNLVLDPGSLTVDENGSGSFEVALATRPPASVSVTVSSADSAAVSVPSQTLTFTTGNWSTARSVTVGGVDDDDALDETVAVTLSASGGGYNGVTAAVSVSVNDDDTVNLVVDPGSLQISENGSGSFDVALATQPSARVSVTVSSGDTDAVSVPSQVLVFTTGNWSTARSVSVGGVDDDDALDESVTVTLSVSGGGYGGVTASVSVSVDDDDTVNLVVDPGSLTVDENGSGSFEVALATQPSASVSVTVSSGDAGAVSVPSQTLTFTTGNWSTARSVTVGGVDDDDALDETVTVTLTASGGGYGGVTASVSVSVNDDDTVNLVVDPGSLTVDENGSGSFDVALATRPSARVSVTVSSGDTDAVSVPSQVLVFTTGNWSTARSVTVGGVDDDDALDETVAVTLSASGGGYGGVTAAVSVSVDDDDTVNLVLDPGSLTVDENGSGSFEVALATRPPARVSVTVSSGDAGAVSVPSQVLVFTTGNWSTARSMTVGGVDDDDAQDETVAVTLTASGGGYSGQTAIVTVTVDDDDTVNLVVDPGSLTVSENGSGTFEVALATRPPATVSVTVSSGDSGAVSVPSQTLTFTTGNWLTARSVTVGGVDDDDASSESVTVTLTASGGDYSGETAAVVVSVTDDDTVNLVVDPGSLTVSENGSGSFDVKLATRPSGQVSVTVTSGDTDAVSVPSQALVFTTGNWSTARSVTVGGVDDADASSESVTVTLTASGADYSGETAAVVVSVTDDDTVNLVVDPGSLTVSENGSGTFDVKLATRPSGQVSVTVTSADSAAVSVPAGTLTFTTGNWSTARSVTVGGVDDADASSESVMVTLTASGADYSGETAAVVVSVTDDDTVNLVVDPGSLTVSENGSGTFDVKLATRPSGQVSVTVSSGDSAAVSVPAQALVFTTGNWSTARSVTVGGVDDADASSESVTVTLTASGADYSGETAAVVVSVTDDDTVNLVVDPGSLTVSENGSGTFDVKLATRPSGQVSVTVTSADSAAVSVPAQALVFTTGNWSTARSVTVGGVDDADASSESVTVTLTASGADYSGETAAVVVSVTDDDTVNLVVDPGSLTVSENGSGTFDVKLATRPSGQVSVTVTSADTAAVSVPAGTLTFTTGNWSTARSVTVGGVDDADASSESVTVTLTASGADYSGETAAVVVSVTDDDTVNLVVDPGSLTVSENGSGTFDVKLATRPSGQVSVTVTSADTAAVSVPAGTLTFTTGNWSTARSVTVGGVDDDDAQGESVTVTLTASGGGYSGVTASVSVSVDDDDTVNLVLDPGSLTVDENGSGSFDVALATQPSATVSVTVSSGDTDAVSVPSQTLTFTTGNWSTARSVTVGGVDDDDAQDETVAVTLTASGGGYSGVTAAVVVSVDDDDTVNLVVDPGSLTVDENGSGSFEVALATQPSASVSVTVSSGDTDAVSVPSQTLTFTTGNWSTARSVTVGGVDDDDAQDETVAVTLTASGGGYSGVTAAVVVSVDDDDTVNLVVDPGSLQISENGSGSFDVALATRPSARVSVTVSSGDTDAVSVPSQVLVFTTGNWSTARSVSVGGVDDDDALDESVVVTLSASGGGYGGVTASVSVSVNDDDTVNLVVDPGSLQISENGSGTFDVALATQPSARVSVTVSSGDTGAVSVPSTTLTFTTGNWSTARSVSVEGVDDDDASDESVVVTLTASGGDYTNETATVEMSVDDDDTVGLVLDQTTLTVDEGDTASFDLTLASRPTAPVTLEVSSGDGGVVSVLTPTVNFLAWTWSTSPSVRVEGVDDDDASDETVTLTITASGGDYSGQTAIVTVTVIDDDTPELVVDPASVSVDENGTASFDVALATRPSARVSVTVSSGDAGAVSVPSQTLTFTTGNWSTARSVTVGGVDDDDALDETVTVTLTASGGGYSGQTAIVTVTVDDDDTVNLVVDPGSLTVDENGSGSFEVALATQPPATVSVTVSSADSAAVSVPSQTLTFTTGNWSTARSVTVGGVDDDDALDETVAVTLSASGGGYSGQTAIVTVTVDDDDIVNLVLDPGSLTVDENGSGSFEVALATQPPATVSVTVSSGDTDAVSVPSQVLVFTTGNWSTARSVTVGGVDDDDALDETVAVTLTASGGGYGGVTASVSVSVDDDDTVNLVVDPGSLTVDENGSGSFDVALATRPPASVSVTVSSGDAGAVSVPSQVLVFTTGNWSTARSVTVGGVDDDDALDESVAVTLTASGGGYSGQTAIVTVTVDDDDTAGLVLDPGSLTVDENGSGSFDVALATRPSARVSVTVSSGDTDAVSVPSQVLVFTTGNWSTARSVSVGGVDDDDALDESVVVTLSASGGGYGGVTASVSVSVDDDDTVNLVVDPGSLTVDENGSGSFDVRLATQPSASVSVTVSSGDTGAVSVPSTTLTFTTGNWSTARSVTVGGVDDDDALDESVTVTLSASGGGYSGVTASVSVSVDDDDTVNLVVDPGSLTVDENGSGSFDVALATQPPATVSVTVSSGDAGAVSVPSQVLVFTTGNWSTARSVSVGGVDDDDALDETVTVTLSASGGGYSGVTASVSVSVDDDDTAGLVLDPGSLTVDENGSGSFEVALATRPSASVSVTVSSGDTDAVSVPSQVLTFTTGNWSTARSVSVGGVDDDDALDETVTVTLSASGGGYGGVTASVSVSVDDDDTVNLVVDPGSLQISENGSGTFDVALATRPSASVSVTVSSGDTGAVSVPSTTLTFTTGNWSTARSVTVGGVDDDDASDESVVVTLTASGGDYTNETATVEMSVDDDDTVGLVLDQTTLTVDEGDTASFDLTLASRPTAPVTLEVSSGDGGVVSVLTPTVNFSAWTWSSSPSVRVEGVDDDDASDETVTLTITASGGDYSGQTAIVTVTVIDDDTPELVVDPASVSVDENGTASFDVTLATEPSQQVSVTVSSGDAGAVSVPSQALVFTTGNWSTARSVTVGGVDDDDALDETVTVTLSASGGDYSGETASVSVSVDDDDTVDLVVDPASVSVDENGTASFDVTLATQPSQQVSVTVSSGDAGAVSVPSQVLVFTTGNWSTARSVTVGGVDDDDAGDETVTVTLTASGGDYTNETATVEMSVDDDDTPALVVDPYSLTVDENGSGTFEVAMATRPPATVSVTVSSGDTGAVSVPSQVLVFTTGDWSTAQSVTVGGVDDDDALHESVTVTLTASGGDYVGVTAEVDVTVNDDDTAGLLALFPSFVVEGRTWLFDVSLATEPSQQVSVTVFSGDSGALSVEPTTLTFTPDDWSTMQKVTLRGVEDDDGIGETVTVTLTASGGDYTGQDATGSVDVIENDPVDLVVDQTTLTVDEGGTASFDVWLATEPSRRVSVTVSSGDTGAVSVPSQALTFTAGNWSTAQSVTVGGVDDDDALHESVTVTLSATGAEYGSVTATLDVAVTDGDTADLLALFPSFVVEGNTWWFDVWLATEPSQPVSVTVLSGDSGALSVEPTTLTFTPDDWSTVQQVTLRGVEDDDGIGETVTVTLTASGGDYTGQDATGSVGVIDNDPVDLVLDQTTLTVDEGGTASFDVWLATEPSRRVSVTVSSGDTGAVSVPSQALTFTAGNWSTAQSVTVGGVDDDDALDESVTVTLSATGAEYGSKMAEVEVAVTDGETADLVVAPDSLTIDEDGSGIFTVSLATRPERQVSVAVSSGDAGAVSVPSQLLRFTKNNWSTPQPVTVGGVDDADAGEESVEVTLAASGADYGGVTATVVVTVTDDETPGLVVDPESLTVAEGGTASFDVELATEPLADVDVIVSSGDPGAASSSGSFKFTRSNWNIAQSVTVRGVSDDDAGDESVTIGLLASGGDYTNETATVTVTVNDNDTPALVVDPESLTVAEDGSAAFTVRLETRPTQTVTVTALSDDAQAASVPSQALTFTTGNWSITQPVTVSGVQDADAADDPVQITVTASGGDSDYQGVTATVSVTVSDDETANLVAAPGSLTIDEDGSGTFTVRLATQPTQQVSVTVSSSDSTVASVASVPSTPLVFTTQNWGTAQSVTVSGVSDDDAADESVTVTLLASGGDYEGKAGTVAVSILDDETAELVVLADLNVDEGGRVDLFVRLAAQPTEQVTVALSTDDPGALSLSTTTLVFTSANWSNLTTMVGLTGVEDDDVTDETVTLTLTIASSGADYAGKDATVNVTVVDNDKLPPTAPDGLAVIREELTQLYAQWATAASAGTPVTGYTVSWREPGGSWTEATATTPGASITGLSDGTEYEVRVKATNALGDSAWSAPITAHTDDCGVQGSDRCALTVGEPATRRINVHDTVPDWDWFEVWLIQDQLYRIDVKGSEASDSGGTLADPYLIVGDLGSGTATDNDGGVGLNSLLLYTPPRTGTYTVVVTEHGEDATGTYTVVATLETPPRFVSSTGLSSPENTSLEQLIVAVDDDADDSILDFQITGGADMDKFSISSQGLLQMIITPNFEDPQDSDTDNVYEVEITVSSGPSTGIADGSASATFTVAILNLSDERPGVVQDLRVVNEDLNSIRLHWSANPDDTEPTSSYKLQVTETGQTPYVITSSSTSATVGSLTPDTHYRFRLKAKNDDGSSGWSASIDGYTDDCGDDLTGACSLGGGGDRIARINIKHNGVDSDWFAVTATERAYRVQVKGSEATDYGGTLTDPRLIIRDHLGESLETQNDDNSGAGLNAARLLHTVLLDSTPSTFYVDVAQSLSAPPGTVGTYTVAAIHDTRAVLTSDRHPEVTENSTFSFEAVISEPDAGDTVSNVRIGGADAAFFAIDVQNHPRAATFEYNITMIIDPDFEHPQDADADNVYRFTVVFLNTTIFGGAPWEVHASVAVTVLDDDTEAPGVPRKRRIDSSLTIPVAYWDPPPNLGPELNHYQVRVADASESPLNWSTSTLFVATTWYYPFYSLSQDTEYVWQVRATNDEGIGQWSPKQYFYLDECADLLGAHTCTLAIDGSKTAVINSKESDHDKDLYEVSLQTNHRYRIDVTGIQTSDSVGTLADPYLKLLDSNGAAIVVAYGTGLNATLFFEPTVAGTYYIEVSENGGDAVGAYEVALALEDRPPRFVGGRSLLLEEHTVLGYTLRASDSDPGHSINGFAVVGGPDMDKFEIQTLQTLRTTADRVLAMNIVPNFEDPQDANGDNIYEVLLQVSSGSGGNQPDRYTLGTFTVTITDRPDEAPAALDLWKINEHRTRIEVGWNEPANDGPPITTYTARLREFSFIITYAWNTVTLGEGIRSHEWIGRVPDTAYEVQVRAHNSDGTGAWSQALLTLTDDCSQATNSACTIQVGTSERGTINTGLTADKDWFEIALDDNALYRIDVEGYGFWPLDDPEVRVYNSSGAAINGAYDNDNGSGLDARLLFEPSSSGTYYIAVGGHGGDEVGQYEVTVAVVDSPPRILGTGSLFLDENATLRHRVTATDNDPGHAITGWSISGGADMDKFSINANGILSMTIEPDHEAPEDADGDNTYEVMVAVTSGPGGGVADRQTTADFSVEITDVDEAPGRPGARTVTATRRQLELAWDEPDNSGPAIDSYEIRLTEQATSNWRSVTVASPALAYSWQTLVAGTWYKYQVRAINDEGSSSWSILASVPTDDCTGRTANNACTVTVGGSATGLIGVDTSVGEADRDWFRVSLEANVRYRISVNGNSLGDPELKIYDSAGDAVTGAEDNDSGSGLNARYVFEPTSAGDYYIEVSAHGGNSFGTYTVEVRAVT